MAVPHRDRGILPGAPVVCVLLLMRPANLPTGRLT